MALKVAHGVRYALKRPLHAPSAEMRRSCALARSDSSLARSRRAACTSCRAAPSALVAASRLASGLVRLGEVFGGAWSPPTVPPQTGHGSPGAKSALTAAARWPGARDPELCLAVVSSLAQTFTSLGRP